MTHKQRVLALLSDGEPHSHHELYDLHVIGHSRISDLRADGHLIEQWRDGDLYMYRLVSLAQSDSSIEQSATGSRDLSYGGKESDCASDVELTLFEDPRPSAYREAA